MPEKNFEILEHTADLGIRVKGRDIKELFINAALALFQIAAEKLPAVSEEKHEIIVNQTGSDMEELLVNWLNELLSLSSAEGLIFEKIQVHNISDKSIEALVTGSDIRNYKVNCEIKAATYHGLKVEKDRFGLTAEVILDV
ncbi:MAG: archease [Candidatus Omnitrophica bacterium]|nr:archease [Candidatus Omnitrophota bacterium]